MYIKIDAHLIFVASQIDHQLVLSYEYVYLKLLELLYLCNKHFDYVLHV